MVFRKNHLKALCAQGRQSYVLDGAKHSGGGARHRRAGGKRFGALERDSRLEATHWWLPVMLNTLLKQVAS